MCSHWCDEVTESKLARGTQMSLTRTSDAAFSSFRKQTPRVNFSRAFSRPGQIQNDGSLMYVRYFHCFPLLLAVNTTKEGEQERDAIDQRDFRDYAGKVLRR